jgi:hypothetical protein
MFRPVTSNRMRVDEPLDPGSARHRIARKYGLEIAPGEFFS